MSTADVTTTRTESAAQIFEVAFADGPFPPVAPPVPSVLGAIGSTPLVRLDRIGLPDVTVFAKLEGLNPGGSMKDRPALRMLVAATLAGELAPGGVVVESSSGNLGCALAQACAVLGHQLIVVVDELTNADTIRRIEALGGRVDVVRSTPGDRTPLLERRIDRVRELVGSLPGAYWPSQYSNTNNPAAHTIGTMREIDEALGGEVDVVVLPTSTTGTLRGCAEYLSEHGRDTRIVAVDAVGSALFGGTSGRRLIPGIGAGVASALSKEARYDDLVRVTDLDSIVAVRRLARREGVLAGGSSGAVLAALGGLAPTLPPGARCAVVLADTGAPYLSTLFDDEWVEQHLGVGPVELGAMVASDRWSGHVPGSVTS